MAVKSAGILMWRARAGTHEVLLIHPGGPFWRRRDLGAWSLPKGAANHGETPEHTARREFQEELGIQAPQHLVPLGEIRQRGGKWVEAFAAEGDFDTSRLESNRFELEWPPHSGKLASFPEVDRAEWFSPLMARQKILPSQSVFLDRLETVLASATSR